MSRFSIGRGRLNSTASASQMLAELRTFPDPTIEQIVALSNDNPGYRFESLWGTLRVVSPTGGKSGVRNSRLNERLGKWARESGYIAFGSSTMFVFGDDLKVSPDETLVRSERWQALSDEQQEGFVQLTPDVVVELVSASQGEGKTRRGLISKCEAMSEAHVPYVLLLDPYAREPEKRELSWGTPPDNFPSDWDEILNL